MAKTRTAKQNKQNLNKNMISSNKVQYCFKMNNLNTEIYNSHWLELIPVAFFTAFVILVTYQHGYQADMSQFSWNSNQSYFDDFFSYFKMVTIIICSVFSLLCLFYRLINQKLGIKKSKVYVCLGVYSVCIICSYILSEHKDFALFGYVDRFEGTITLLAYLVMFIYIFNTVNSEKQLKWIIYPLGITCIIEGILGIGQYYGFDFFRTAIGQKLITTNKVLSSGISMNDAINNAAMNGETALGFNFQKGQIYQTVYNLNYVSFYLTLLIPLFIMLFIYLNQNKNAHKGVKIIVCGLIVALNIFGLLGSDSSGGILGLGATVIFAVIYLNRRLLKWWKPILAVFLIACVSCILTVSTWVPELSRTMSSSTVSETSATTTHELKGIETHENKIVIDIDDNTITLAITSADMDGISVTDQNNSIIELESAGEQGVYNFVDDRLEECQLKGIIAQGDHYIQFTDNKHEMDWTFVLDGGIIRYVAVTGNVTNIDTAESSLFSNHLGFGSGRGYIWSRGIPLMKDSILFGTGADTFAIVFPQYDYVGKYNAGYYTKERNVIVDKAHNMYLNMFVTTGGVSLIAFVGILILYFVECFKIYRKVEYDDFLPYCGFGIFIGIIGFAVAGLVNDSSVSVMPMFYGLLATGYAINVMLRKRIKNGEINAEV